MNKSRMMVEHKEIFGGYYVRDNGRWFWKETPESSPILVSGGWLIKKLNEAKTKKPEVSAPSAAPVVEKKEESFSPLPTTTKKPVQPKKKAPEASKDEPKAPEAQ
jgi:hypothetical protein